MDKKEQKNEDNKKIENINRQQIIDEIKNDVKKEVFDWIRKWRSRVIGGICLFSLITLLTMCWQIYTRVRNNASRFIIHSITEKFAEPNIKITLTGVAENQAQKIIEDEVRPGIEQINNETSRELVAFKNLIDDFKEKSKDEYNKLANEIEGIKKEIALFRDYLDKSKVEFSKEYEKQAQQVALLEERNKLVELADKSIADGDSKSFEQLKDYAASPVKVELANAAKAEMLRVKNFYVGTTRIKGATITYTSPTGEKLIDEKIPTNILLLDLTKHRDWRIRAKAAQLLKDRKEKGVPEALLEAIRTDPILDVRRDSLNSFESLTDFKRSDILDFEPAAHWWEKNKQQFEEQIDRKVPNN